MMRLVIDGVDCPMVGKTPKLPTYDARRLSDIDAWRDGDQVEVTVASVPTTDTLFEYGASLHHATRFNDGYHAATLSLDGVTVYEGQATLLGVDSHKGEVTYRVRLRRGGAEWADIAATTKLAELVLPYRSQMTLPAIEASWQGDSVVRFLPLWRDSYPESAATGLYQSQRTLMPHHYHPFISVMAIIDELVARSGYKLQSHFLASDFFSRLMMSGAWRNVESATTYAKMGFKAYRTKTVTAAAGVDGRVYVWEPVMASNVGAVVDTVNPAAVTDEDVMVGDAYTNGGCFTFSNNRPIFTPKREITVAFDYHLRYTTDTLIASSKYLKGFDHINLGTGCEVEVKLNNPYTDRRNSVVAGIEYKLFIFDFNPSHYYHLLGFGDITEAITTVTLPKSIGSSVILFSKTSEDDGFLPFEGDWALYNGYVEATGHRTIEIDVRSAYEKWTPSSPKRFNDIFFGGAAEGQTLTLHSGCYVTPVFSGVAGYGEGVDWSDITHHNISLAEILRAVQHMFNLRIYSHSPSKTLIIEPRDVFYRTVVDWRSRQVDEPHSLDEGVVDSFATTTLKYCAGDGVVSRLAEATGSETGSWSYHIEGYAAKHSVDNRVNPLFAPTASVTDFSPSAPSAEVLTAGDRDSIYDEGLSPRVVLYDGVIPLPDDEWWASANDPHGYPHAAFHSPLSGATLSFGDGDGMVGLHRYYDNELKEWAEREVVEMTLYIPPLEYAALFDPNHDGATISSLFRLSFDGDSSLFRLLAIDNYDTEHHTARCRFLRTLND